MTFPPPLLAGIADWVRCESPSSSPAALHDMAQLIAGDARRLGLCCALLTLDPATGPALLVTRPEHAQDSPGPLILGHYDTVHPLGALAKNPCRVEGERFYGPGSYDMKAGLYLALRAMAETRRADGMPVRMLIVPDEETGSHHSRALIESQASRTTVALVGEPARALGGACVTARKGTGRIVLNVHGRPAHAGLAHEKGRSAIRELAHQVLFLEDLTDYNSGLTVSVGRIEGGTTTNVVPGFATAAADVRLPDDGAATVLRERLDQLRSRDPDVEVQVALTLNRPPMPRTAAQAALFAQARRAASAIGFDLTEAPPTGGASDANFLAALGIPTLDALGADGDGAHTQQEYVLVGTLQARLALWRQLLQTLG